MSNHASRKSGFIYRAAGVSVREGHVLLHRGEAEDSWSLPGGKPEFLETSDAALVREMREEIDVDVAVGRLLWVMEYFFSHAGRDFHELGFYYEMQLPADSPHLDPRREFTGTEGRNRLIFRWFPIASLTNVRLYPTYLRTALADLPASPRHIVSVEPDDDPAA